MFWSAACHSGYLCVLCSLRLRHRTLFCFHFIRTETLHARTTTTLAFCFRLLDSFFMRTTKVHVSRNIKLICLYIIIIIEIASVNFVYA